MKYARGLIPDRHDDRDYRFSRLAAARSIVCATLPPLLSLRPDCTPVRAQGALSACTGFAGAVGMLEYLLARAGRPMALAPLYPYFYARLREHAIRKDEGATIRDTCIVLHGHGCAPEALWSYEPTKFADAPDGHANAHARHQKLGTYYRVNGAAEVKQALFLNQPVIYGIACFESMDDESVARTGRIPLPNPEVEAFGGGHAICLVGYDDREQQFEFKNSWSTQWGNGGYGYLPYAYFEPVRQLVWDGWTGVLAEMDAA